MILRHNVLEDRGLALDFLAICDGFCLRLPLHNLWRNQLRNLLITYIAISGATHCVNSTVTCVALARSAHQGPPARPDRLVQPLVFLLRTTLLPISFVHNNCYSNHANRKSISSSKKYYSVSHLCVRQNFQTLYNL